MILKKLDVEIIRVFENSSKDSSIPIYEEVGEFVKQQAKICSQTLIALL